MGTKVELRNVSKAFTNVPVLQDVSLVIESGQTAAVLGPSGCGKTTMLRVIAGLEWADGGQVVFDGQDVTVQPAKRRRAVLVPQEGALFPHLTVTQNISFGLHGRRRRKQNREWVTTLINTLDLTGLENRRPSGLSGGQASRVAIARALAPLPDLVLLDEPFAALDKNLRESVRLAVKALAKQHNITLVLVTHDQEEALSFADKIIVVDQGQITGTGAPRDVYMRPPSPEVATFLGEANFVPATLSNNMAVTEFGTFPVVNQDGTSVVASNGNPVEPVTGTVMLRPEQIIITYDNEQLGQQDVHRDGDSDTNDASVQQDVHGDGDSDTNDALVQQDVHGDGDSNTNDAPVQKGELENSILEQMGTSQTGTGAQTMTVEHVVYHGHDSVLHGHSANGTKLISRVAYPVEPQQTYTMSIAAPVVFYAD